MREVAGWPDSEVERLLQAPGIIRNRKKISATLRNARELVALVERHGSVRSYLDSFADDAELVADIDTWAHDIGPPSIRWFSRCSRLPVTQGVSGRRHARARPRQEGEAAVRAEFRVGDHVSWNSEAGRVSGIIRKKITAPITFKGYTVHASKAEPQYLIESDKTDHLAMHRGRALRKIARRPGARGANAARQGSRKRRV